MSERRKQAEFLKALLACADGPEQRDLQERLQMAERDERCTKRACRLVVVVTLVALSVLGYLAVLQVPDTMSRPAAVALRFAQALALGSAMCAGVFFGLMFWQRALIQRLHTEVRKLVTAHLSHRAPPAGFVSTVTVQGGDTAVYQVGTHPRSAAVAEILTLPKAS